MICIVILVGCESFLESNFPDILVICETNLDDSTDSGNFMMNLLLKSMVKEGLPFAQNLSLENSLLILIYIFHNFIQCFTSFCSINHLLHFYAWFLMPFHLDGILSIKLSANVFAFPDFNIHHHKHRLTNSGGTDRPSKILL